MSIRQGYYRVGDVIQLSGNFVGGDGGPMVATGVTLTIKKPGTALVVMPLTADSLGRVATTLATDVAGRWNLRLACTGPTPSVHESYLHVVQSTVLPPI